MPFFRRICPWTNSACTPRTDCRAGRVRDAAVQLAKLRLLVRPTQSRRHPRGNLGDTPTARLVPGRTDLAFGRNSGFARRPPRRLSAVRGLTRSLVARWALRHLAGSDSFREVPDSLAPDQVRGSASGVTGAGRPGCGWEVSPAGLSRCVTRAGGLPARRIAM